MSVAWIGLGVSAVGTAATAYSASKAGDAPAPMQSDPGKDLLKYISGLKKGLPDLQSLEWQYRPEFGKLNIADQEQYLNALLGFSRQASEGARQEIGAERVADINSMRERTGGVVGMIGGITPNLQRMEQNQAALAQERYNAAQGLSAQERRLADQTARESFAARGRLNDNAGVAAEILSREEVLSAKRAEAARMGAQSFETSQRYSSPILDLLGAVPASVASGRDFIGLSQSIIGQNTPQLINPDAGINLGAQNAANMNAYMNARASAKANQAALYAKSGESIANLGLQIYKSSI